MNMKQLYLFTTKWWVGFQFHLQIQCMCEFNHEGQVDKYIYQFM